MMTMMSGLDGTTSVSAPSPFSNDLTLTQLGVKIANGPGGNGWAAIRWLSFFGAYLAICALAPVLASALRRRTALVRYVAVLVTAALLFRPPTFARLGGEFSVVLWLGSFWLPVAWMALCLIAVARRDTGFQIANNQ
jgi:hypothetical protein